MACATGERAKILRDSKENLAKNNAKTWDKAARIEGMKLSIRMYIYALQHSQRLPILGA